MYLNHNIKKRYIKNIFILLLLLALFIVPTTKNIRAYTISRYTRTRNSMHIYENDMISEDTTSDEDDEERDINVEDEQDVVEKYDNEQIQIE